METESQIKPRFRNDLVAQQLEEEGVQYVDVTDPNSGSTFRFYDVEYSIACGMNGERDLAGLVEWARADLGIETSPEELGQVMSTLAELGYLDAGMVEIPADGGFELGAPGATTVPAGVDAAPELELGAPGAATTDEQAHESPHLRAPELELGAPGASAEDIHRQATRPVEALELGPPGAAFDSDAMLNAPTNGAGRNEAVELASEDLEEYKSQVTEMPRPPASAAPPPPPGTDDDMSFAGLMDAEGPPAARKIEAKAPSVPMPSPDHTPTPPPPIEITAEAPPESKRPTTVKFDADEPTNLPGAMPDDDDEDVSVDLSAHISLEKKDVEEAVRASRVMMVPELPADLKEAAAADTSDIDKTMPAMPLPPPPSTQQLAAAIEPSSVLPVESGPSGPVATATALPERPIAAVTSKPIDVARAPAGVTSGKKSGMGGVLAFLAVLVLAGGAAVYWFQFRTPAEPGTATPAAPTAEAPPATPTNPIVPPPAPALPVAKLAERTGSISEAKAVVAGRVAWLADASKDVAAGDPVVKLQGFQRWEQQKTNATSRLEFYQGELDKAKAANNAAAVEKDEKKVQEKKDLINQAETELAKLTVVAPAAGKLELAAKPGAPVAAGAVVAKVSGGGPQLVATFDAGAPGVAGDYKAAGASCQLAAKATPDKRAACVVEGVEGSQVNVRVVDGSPFKAGDDVTLAPPK